MLIPPAEYMISMSKQVLGYCTSGYQRVFVSPEGAALVEKHDKLFDTLMFASDPETWKEHLGAEDGLVKFLEAGKALPVADWMLPEELDMHNRILKGGYTGVFNWYKAALHLDPAHEDLALTAEDKKVTVPTLLAITENDYAIIPDMQLQMTRTAAEDLTVERLQTGHWAMLEAKDKVEELLENFATTRGL
jgi:soluble epoxide hydrolase / lipid-phosphate phosphatase